MSKHTLEEGHVLELLTSRAPLGFRRSHGRRLVHQGAGIRRSSNGLLGEVGEVPSADSDTSMICGSNVRVNRKDDTSDFRTRFVVIGDFCSRELAQMYICSVNT